MSILPLHVVMMDDAIKRERRYLPQDAGTLPALHGTEGS